MVRIVGLLQAWSSSCPCTCYKTTTSLVTPRLRIATRIVRPYSSAPPISRRHLLHGARRGTTHVQRQISHIQNVPTEHNAVIHDVYEPNTGSWQYIVADTSSSHAIIIDPVLDFEAATAEITTKTADALLAVIDEEKYNVQMILETHAHADHLTAANYLRQRLARSQKQAPTVGIGKRIVDVQKFWAGRYNIPAEEYQGAFDKLFDDDETFHVGSLAGVAMHLPGHTPDHMGYMIAGKRCTCRGCVEANPAFRQHLCR